MARNLLADAADEVNTAKEAVSDPDARDRLEVLADRLQSQADRKTTPAFGVLDRIHAELREIERQTDDPIATGAIERAREKSRGEISFARSLPASRSTGLWLRKRSVAAARSSPRAGAGKS